MTNSDKDHFPTNVESVVIIYCVLIGLLIPIAVVGNSLVLAAIHRTPSLRSRTTVFLCSLAISDLVVGFLVQPLYIASEFTTVGFMRPLMELASYTACGVSLCTMTAISVDRLLALHYHMRYPTLMTNSRAALTSVAICLIISLLSVIYFWNRTVYLILTVIVICISLLISSVCYITIYRIVHRHQLQIFAQQRVTQSSSASPNANMIQLKKSALNTFVFFVVMILCYFPAVISISIYELTSVGDWTKALNFTEVAVMLNSSINPFLYCWRLPCLRTAVAKICRNIICRRSEELIQPNNFALA